MNLIISVCMATYNGQNFIHEQVRGILDQLSDTDELIVSDDGSTDKTIAEIEAFKDNRIKLFINAGPKGPVGNFENALRAASGDIIFLADQDDIWKPGKIKAHLKLQEKYDLVLSNAVVTNEKGEVIFNSFFKERGSKPGFFNNIMRNSYTGCCMSFNRNILNLALPFPAYIHMHDWWIGLVAEVKGKVAFCNEPLMYYVRHQTNASPTLGKSGYTPLKRLQNRVQLIYGLLFILFK